MKNVIFSNGLIDICIKYQTTVEYTITTSGFL